jgi:hypothetical protein
VWDLTTPTNIRVEVKSAAYLQSWFQKELSPISFGTRKTLAWDRNSNTFAAVPQRHADVYVFALLKHTDKETVNPLELNQWEFYVLSTGVLNQRSQDSITLASLRALTTVKLFGELQKAVLEAAIEPCGRQVLDESSPADC